MLASNFNTMTLQPPPTQEWYMDTGAETHMTSNSGNLCSSHFPSFSTPSNIVVGNGPLLPVTHTDSVTFPATCGPLHLNNVLVSPHLIKNLISVRQFTIENRCSIEFDPSGFSVKDLKTQNVIVRCNSSGPLYPLLSSVFRPLALTGGVSSSTLWHRRLGHLGHEALSSLGSSCAITCNKSNSEHLCHACQLGRHVCLPFPTSSSRAINNFDIIHCDLWTSPVPSISGYKYYLVILDDCSHYLWTFPLRAKSDTSLFIYQHGHDTIYLLLYVDNIVLTSSSDSLLQWVITALQQEFSMTDLGPLHHFLGLTVTRHPDGFHLSQRQYILEVLERAGMTDCKPCSTPVDTSGKLSGTEGQSVTDPTHYQGLAGALQYLTFTRPDISYVVQQVCLHMHDPREPHYMLIKRILRYLHGTLDHGLHLRPTDVSTLVAYSNADWVGCPDTRRSTSGFAVFLGDNLVSWSSKRQPTVSRSSAEAEYRVVANTVAETTWLRQLLQEMHLPLKRATVVFCDNVSAVYLSSNPVNHQRTKHIEIDLHFVRERVAVGAVRVLHVPTSSQYADIFTKGLPSSVFTEFRSSLNVFPCR
jgi:hypothetical protein